MPYMRWHPDTGVPSVFHDLKDVPEDWLAHHPGDHAKRPPAQAPDMAEVGAAPNEALPQTTAPWDEKQVGASRSEIIGQLKARNIAFRVTAKTDVLYALLMSHVERENEDETP